MHEVKGQASFKRSSDKQEKKTDNEQVVLMLHSFAAFLLIHFAMHYGLSNFKRRASEL